MTQLVLWGQVRIVGTCYKQIHAGSATLSMAPRIPPILTRSTISLQLGNSINHLVSKIILRTNPISSDNCHH